MQSRWRQWLLQLPLTCEVCGTWPSKAVCPACMARWCQPVNRCQCCAARVPEGVLACGECVTAASRNAPALHRCIAVVDYAYPWQQLMARFKFQAEPGWADVFANMLLHAPGTKELLATCDVMVAIPASRQRLAQRGYNQAWLLSKALAAHSPAPPDTSSRPFPQLLHGLERRRETATQHRLSRQQRLRNLDGAFAAAPDLQARLIQAPIHHVVLIDDVSTTGATLQAAARTLRQAGVEKVSAMVVCKT